MNTVLVLVALLVIVGIVFWLKKSGSAKSSSEAPNLEGSSTPTARSQVAPAAKPQESGQAAPAAKASATDVADAAAEVSTDVQARAEAEADESGDSSQSEQDDEVSADDELSVDEEIEAPASSGGTPPPPPQRLDAESGKARQRRLNSMRRGLARSRTEEGFFGRLKAIFNSKPTLNEELAEEIEEVLLTSDVGVETTEALLGAIREAIASGSAKDEAAIWDLLRERATSLLKVSVPSPAAANGPKVILMVGVNGAGKTTTIGKLAQKYQAEGKTVMLSAGDTFRAAAVEQLKAWGQRTGCEVIAGKADADPSSVLFDAIDAAKARGADILLADTAGRLHTKTNLMQEMTKIYKTAGKALEGAPHEVFLVIDATNGQNAVAQAREFKEALPLSGLVLTKLDGTARGGVVLGICDALSVPVRFIGMGEGPEDLHEFDAAAFVEALLGSDDEGLAA